MFFREFANGSKLGLDLRSWYFPLLGIGMLAFLSGCATNAVRIPVPISLANKVQVAGAGHVRYWGDAPISRKDMANAVGERLAQIREKRPRLLAQRRRLMSYLALSGGGSNGAYGAGFLNGWTASGNRPVFEAVSGVSAGALMAPFVFLGPRYDSALKEIYTLYSTKDILQPRVLAGLLGADGLSSSQPLKELIARYVDRKFLAAISEEHKKGRRLLVGTTNLDAERPVIWDMGRVAMGNDARALSLFRQILLASASIPGVFPPIYIKVETGGKNYEEMHVDGGTTENTFLLPTHFDVRGFDDKFGVKWRRRIFVLVNDKTDPSPEAVKGSALDIAGRSITTLIKQQTQGDLIKLYLRAKENNIAFAMNSIPASFSKKSTEPFDKAYMRALYKLGYNNGLKQIGWRKQPRGL